MAVLLLGEVTNGELSVDATAKAVNAVKGLGDVTVLCAGSSAKAAGEAAAKIDGVAKVLVAEDALYGHRLAEPTAALLVSLAGDYSHIAAPATTNHHWQALELGVAQQLHRSVERIHVQVCNAALLACASRRIC